MKLLDLSLPALMYNYVKNKPDKVIDHISPSMLGGCPRAHYFAIKHVKQTTPPSPGALLNFEMGFLYEQLMAKALDGNVKLLDTRCVFDKELNVKGEFDFALVDDNGEVEVIDCKTESILAAGHRKRQKIDYIEASERYVIQLGTYMLLLRRKGCTVNRGRLVSITKDNGMMHEYFVPYTQELEDKIMVKIDYMNDCLKRNVVPDCTCEGWMVGYSSYGNPNTQIKNSTGKIVNSECCPDSIEQLEQWREEFNKKEKLNEY